MDELPVVPVSTAEQVQERHVVLPSPGEAITSELTGNTYEIGDKLGEGNFGIAYS